MAPRVQTELSTITWNPARRARAMFPAGSLHLAASSTPPTTSRRWEPPPEAGHERPRRERRCHEGERTECDRPASHGGHLA